MNWKYRGTTIAVDGDAVFYAEVDGDRIEATSLSGMKKKIAAYQDGRRKFDVPCWVVQVDGLESRDDDIEVVAGRAVYTGYNLVGGHPKLAWHEDDVAADVRVDEFDVTLWAFPIARAAAGAGRPSAVQRLQGALAEYSQARALFRERLEKLQVYRLPEYISRDGGVAIEAQVAEHLTGAGECRHD